MKQLILISFVILVGQTSFGCDNYIIAFDAFSYHHVEDQKYDGENKYNNHHKLSGFECEKAVVNDIIDYQINPYRRI